MLRLSTTRLVMGLLLALAAMVVPAMLPGGGQAAAQTVIRDIRVTGNQRVEPETVRSYLTFSVGERYDAVKADESLKVLIGTGLFGDVRINQAGGVVTVAVSENQLINQVVFEGNREIKDETLSAEVQLKPRSVLSRSRVQADVQRILDVYRRSGYYGATVDAQVIELDRNRINLVFAIQEGPDTKVLSINFIGNSVFSDSQLRDVVTTSENNWFSFLKSTDVYDQDRLNLDRELLRRYYLKNGYADARVVSAVADLDREGKGFFITFTVEEGELYRFGAVDVEATLASVDPVSLRPELLTVPGEIYNAEQIDKSVEKMTIAVAQQGYAFGLVRPRVERDPISRTINVVYVVEQGPRVYIERINVVGNGRTKDYVIRREIRLAEGDAYNKLLVDRARLRLQGLGYFKSVKVTSDPGSAPDRVVLNYLLEEQPTGELSLAAGYSSQEGVIGEIAYTERNLLGKGQFLRVKLSGSVESGQLDVSFTEPRFLDRNIAAGIDAFHRETDFEDEAGFNSRKTGGGLRLGFALTDTIYLNNSYTLTNDEVEVANSDVDAENGRCNPDSGNFSPGLCEIDGTALISEYAFTLTYDTRNNRQNPSRGLYFSAGPELAGLGGDVNYIRGIAEGRAYYPIYDGVTLVGRAIGGVIEGWGGDDVRIVDGFYKGGETIRGFDTAGIGPRARNTEDALGGKVFYAGTVEVRFPIPLLPEELGFGGAIFADAGSVFDTDAGGAPKCRADSGADDFCVDDSSEIRTSVGASLLWASPVGPLRADFAYVISKEDFDETELFRFGAATKF